MGRGRHKISPLVSLGHLEQKGQGWVLFFLLRLSLGWVLPAEISWEMGILAPWGQSLLCGWLLPRRGQSCQRNRSPLPTLVVGEPELLSCSGPLPLESHSPCGSLHEPWGPLSSGGGALVSLAGRQASPPLPSPPGGNPHKSRGCAKLPLGHPQQPIPAAGTRLLQLCKCAAGEQDVSFLFWAASCLDLGFSWGDLLCLVPGAGAGEGVVPIHQHHPLSLPPPLNDSRF